MYTYKIHLRKEHVIIYNSIIITIINNNQEEEEDNNSHQNDKVLELLAAHCIAVGGDKHEADEHDCMAAHSG